MEPSPEVVIRRMQSGDEARGCAGMMSASEPWITLHRSLDDNLKLLVDPAKEAYVALADNTLAGVLLLHLHGPLNGYLQAICVAPNFRGSGIGSKLMHFAEERIFQFSPNVFLCVSSFNEHAQKIYARLGYEQIGEFKDYIVSGHSEILMRKTRGPLSEHAPDRGP